MTDRILPRAVAIAPCIEVDAAERWWAQLGFLRAAGTQGADYRILSDGNGGELHLQRAPDGWLVPGRNPFGIYLYSPHVDKLALIARDQIVEPGKAPERKDWGMYEFSLTGPDGLLVRVGWPTRLIEGA